LIANEIMKPPILRTYPVPRSKRLREFTGLSRSYLKLSARSNFSSAVSMLSSPRWKSGSIPKPNLDTVFQRYDGRPPRSACSHTPPGRLSFREPRLHSFSKRPCKTATEFAPVDAQSVTEFGRGRVSVAMNQRSALTAKTSHIRSAKHEVSQKLKISLSNSFSTKGKS